MELQWFLLFFSMSVSLSCPVREAKYRLPNQPRLVLYFQTTHNEDGQAISMLPLIQKRTAVTHLIISAFHVNEDSDIHLNDDTPDAPKFSTLWSEARIVKEAGVKVMGMVGGAAPGSFTTATLDGDEATFEKYYNKLKTVIWTHDLQGLDLDVEQAMSQGGITRLVRRLRKDFGEGFLITLSPVASALHTVKSLSGFNFYELNASVGSDIAFYNTQFYSGFGSLSTPQDYDTIISKGWDPMKIVAGTLTSPINGFGYVSNDKLHQTFMYLRDKYGSIGGIMGWEYFGGELHDQKEPWRWAEIITDILYPDS